MTKKNSTKRALMTSVLAIVLCLTMLIGTTFAWFTDTASTGVNTIKSGTLKVDIVAATATDTSLKDQKMSFVNKDGDANILWEPGVTFKTPSFKIKSTGSLALKYKLELNGVTGDKQLLDVIEFSVVDAATGEAVDLNSFVDHLTPDAALSKELYIQGHMAETAGNEYQNLELTDLGITVYATQDTVEKDSVDENYDANAGYLLPVTTVAELTAAVADGNSVVLQDDVTLTKTLTVTNGKAVTIDLNGNDINNTSDIWNTDTGDWSLASVRGSSSALTIKGGDFAAKKDDCYAVDVQDGATVTIEDGTFVGNIHAVYVQQGTAYIKGGTFSVQQKYNQAGKENEFVLNCYDANRAAGTAKIIVTGGTFVNFNPADCQAEGEHTNFVANGYTVTSETQTNGDIYYTVVPE